MDRARPWLIAIAVLLALIAWLLWRLLLWSHGGDGAGAAVLLFG